jgi:hypothetical protein
MVIHSRRLRGCWMILTRQEHICSILIPKVSKFYFSSVSSFTSMDEILPMGAADEEG